MNYIFRMNILKKQAQILYRCGKAIRILTWLISIVSNPIKIVVVVVVFVLFFCSKTLVPKMFGQKKYRPTNF